MLIQFVLKIKIIFIFYFCLLFENKIIGNFIEFQKVPKISIFLPIYNKEKFLIRSIKSIQNQSLKDLEIVAINDYSTDKTLPLLKKLSKKDSRIKIINNDRNHGLLYSRAMGILNSTGEFIMNLDPDDQLEGKNNLEYLYKIVKKSKVDFLSFAYKRKKKTLIKCSNYNKILKQPELFRSSIYHYNRIKDYLIWNKLIKRQLFLKAYKEFKEKIYYEKWNYHEDNIWSILVYKYANSMICIPKLIYIYYSYKESLMKNKRNNIIEIKNFIYKEKMLRKIINIDVNNKKFFAHFYKSFFLHYKKLQFLKNNLNLNYNFFKSITICHKLQKCPNYFAKCILKLIKI